MKGYLVKVEEIGFSAKEPEQTQRPGYHLVSPEMIEIAYPIPSAFRAFTPYVNVALGKESFLR